MSTQKKIGGEPFPENKAIQDMKTIYGPSKNNPPNRKQFMQLPKRMSLSNKELLDKSIEQLKAELLEYFFDSRLKGEEDRFIKTVDAYATEKAKELLHKEKKEPTNYSTDPVIVKIGEGLEFKFSKRPTTVESSEPQEKKFDLPAACVFNLQQIALADDEMVKQPGAAEKYRFIARHILELFTRKPLA